MIKSKEENPTSSTELDLPLPTNFIYKHHNTREIVLSTKSIIGSHGVAIEYPTTVIQVLVLDPDRNFVAIQNMKHKPIDFHGKSFDSTQRILYCIVHNDIAYWISRIIEIPYGIWFDDLVEFMKYISECTFA